MHRRCARRGPISDLGRFHAQKYAVLPESQRERYHLHAYTDEPRPELLTAGLGAGFAVMNVSIKPYACCRYNHALIDGVPTSACTCWSCRSDADQARSLVEIAADWPRPASGPLERFNAAILALAGTLGTPRFIETHRLAPFKERGTDVNVVLDLMIHDIDLIQSLVGAPIESIDAVGASVFSAGLDIANARIRYANGCVANTTASRVSMKMERKLRMFQDDAYVSIDLQQKILTIVRKPGQGSEMPKGRSSSRGARTNRAMR